VSRQLLRASLPLMATALAVAAGGGLAPVAAASITIPAPMSITTSQTVTLPSSLCATLNAAYPGSEPNCAGILVVTGSDYLPIPTTGRSSGAAQPDSIAPGYWYWSYTDHLCSGAGCWLWNDSLSMDGVANGDAVYQWNVQCTPGGFSYCSWHGYSFNGGGAPYYAMECGMDVVAEQVPPVPPGYHGVRQWITDYEPPAKFNM